MGLREEYESAKAEEGAIFDEMQALVNEWIDGGTQGEKPQRILELEEKWYQLKKRSIEKRDALHQGCTCGSSDCPKCGRSFSGKVRLPQAKPFGNRVSRHPGKPSIVIDRSYTTEVRNSDWVEPKEEDFNWNADRRFRLETEADRLAMEHGIEQDEIMRQAEEMAMTIGIDRALDELAKGSLEQDMRAVGQDPSNPVLYEHDDYYERPVNTEPVFDAAAEQVFKAFDDSIVPDLSETQQSQLGREPNEQVPSPQDPMNTPKGY